MAAASTSVQNKARGPHVNLFDMPELMPGAQPGANPAQREEFEARCKALHYEAVGEEKYEAAVNQASSGAGATVSDLELMFPNLDADLIRALRAEAPSAQHAIETLLALSAATGEPGEADQQRPSPPPLPVGVEDHDKFPTLCDAKGWQVLGSAKAIDAADEEPGSIWRDRAKAAADKPAPKPQPPAAASAWGKKRETGAKKVDEVEGVQPETDYEFRQRMGQKRAQNKLQYGRCRGKGAGKGAAVGGTVRSGGADSGSEMSDEACPAGDED
jgi:hypothetical protein